MRMAVASGDVMLVCVMWRSIERADGSGESVIAYTGTSKE